MFKGLFGLEEFLQVSMTADDSTRLTSQRDEFVGALNSDWIRAKSFDRCLMKILINSFYRMKDVGYTSRSTLEL